MDGCDGWMDEPQGVLQGNAAGPTIWSTITSVIVKILGGKGFSKRFCSAISRNVFLIVCFTFVDDWDLIQSGQDPHEVAASMQMVIREWGV